MIDQTELPNGWELKKLGEVCEKAKPVRRNEKSPTGEFIYLDIGGIDNKTNTIVSYKTFQWKDAPSRAQQIVKVNDVLFSTVRTYLKNIAFVNKEIFNNQIGSSGFTVIRAAHNIANPRYLFFYSISETFLQPLNELQTGSSYPAVRDKDVFDQLIPLPPLPTQHAIVAKIEQLFSELDNGKAQLETARQQLKVYRQAVLKWAFEGRLTNTDVVEGELPEAWKWVKLGEVSEKIFDGPFGSHLKSSDYVAEGVRVIRLENIGVLEFKDEYQTFVTEEKYTTIQKHTVSSGDIVFSSFIMGETRVTVLPSHIQKAINKADCFCVRTIPKTIDSKYLAYYLSTKALYNQLVDEVHGATRPRINTTQLKLCLIPYCSLAEQHRIVAEIESRLSVCEQLEATIAQSLAQAEALRQSVLKRAFEGRLL